MPHLARPDPLSSELAPGACTVHFCALGFGNLTCLINDPVLSPAEAAATFAAHANAASSGRASSSGGGGGAAGGTGGGTGGQQLRLLLPPNADLVVVLVNGLPLPLVVTTRQLAAGEEVAMAYGGRYWAAWVAQKEVVALGGVGGAAAGAAGSAGAAAGAPDGAAGAAGGATSWW